MAYRKHRSRPGGAVWALATSQHGVVARRQLLELGLSPKAVKHRIARGRLHLVHRGVYVVGRPQLTQTARWMAAVLACGPDAVLSGESAAGLWGIRPVRSALEVTVRPDQRRRRPGIIVHRRQLVPEDVAAEKPDSGDASDPNSDSTRAPRVGALQLETAVNEADKLDRVDPETLRAALELLPAEGGVAPPRALLDRHTFVLTDSELERRFLPLARRADLPRPLTGRWVNDFEIDFYWPELRLVVETDGLRYHRTAAQQSRDRLRDQRHAAAGLTCLRFTHRQVAREEGHVVATLRAVAARLRRV